MFKKVILSCLACITLFSLTGCGEKQVEGTLEEIMTKVYADIPEDERPMLLTNIEVDEEEPVWDILNDIYESEDENRFIFV